MPRYRIILITVAALATAAFRPLPGQVVDTSARLEPGRRVRLTSVKRPKALRSPYREGVLARLDADSLRIVQVRGDTVVVARADVRQVEVLVRTGSPRRRLLLGTAAGVVGGGVLGIALGGSAGGCGDLPGCTSSVDTGGSFAAGAAVGGAIGLFVAALTGVHRWRVVRDF
jgi:hypothetical protein